MNYLLLFGAGLIWGSQYILNKSALESFSTSVIATGRISIGFFILTLLTTTEKLPDNQPKNGFWKALPDFILIGLLEATLPCIFVAWAQKNLPSSIVAILIGTVPLFTILLEVFFIQGSRITHKKMSGIVLGFIGVVVLMLPELFASYEHISSHSTSLLFPMLAVLASALFFAVAMLLIQVRLESLFGPIRSAQGILTGAVITTIPIMLILTYPWHMTASHVSVPSLIALIALGIFCSGFAYALFVMLIKRAGSSFASTCNYLVPPIGTFLGIAFSGEKITSHLLLSLGLILLSLWLVQGEKASHRLQP